MASTKQYPIASFYFRVTVGGEPSIADAAFHEVSGLTMGQPNLSATHAEIRLKQALQPTDGEWLEWMQSDSATPRNMVIRLISANEENAEVARWEITGARPQKRELGPSGDIETLILTFETMERKK